MTDREERQRVIEVLQNIVDWMEAANYIVATPERRHALLYAIASIKTDLRYDLLYEETSEQADKQADKPTTKNDCETCIHNKGVLECDMYGCKYEPTTKNDLGVDYLGIDAISRQEAIDTIRQLYLDLASQKAVVDLLKVLPSVTPQLSSGLEKNSKKLEKGIPKNDLGVDWDELKHKILMEVDSGTDDAWLAYGEVCNRISNSIDEFVADMRGGEE